MRHLTLPAVVTALVLCTAACSPPNTGEPANAANGDRVPIDDSSGSLIFDSDGVTIRYVDQGSGRPVILLHGFTESVASWTDGPTYSALLDAGYRVIAMDARGHGQSGKPHVPDVYGVQMAQDVVRLMNHLGIERAQVVGYSMGADIAFKLLELAPERLRSVTLGGFGGDPMGGWTASDFDLLVLADALERGEGMKPLLREPYASGVPPLSENEVLSLNDEWMAGNDPLALAAILRSFDELSVSDDVRRASRVPAMVIVGELDPERPEGNALLDVMATLEYVVVPSADHEAVRGERAFVDAVLGFLARNAQRP